MGAVSCLGDGSAQLCRDQGPIGCQCARLGFICGPVPQLRTRVHSGLPVLTASSCVPRPPWREPKFALLYLGAHPTGMFSRSDHVQPLLVPQEGSQRPHATSWQQFRAVLRKNLLLRLRGG